MHMKMLVDFTRIRFKPPAFKTLNHCEESIKVFFLSKPTETLLNFKNNLTINAWYKK